MAYESKDNGDCDDRVFRFPLTFSLCLIFQETLPEIEVTNFSLKEKTNTVGNNTTLLSINLLYYINANEIPGELSGKNMISSRETNMLSSHVKRSPLLRPHNTSHLSQQQQKIQ